MIKFKKTTTNTCKATKVAVSNGVLVDIETGETINFYSLIAERLGENIPLEISVSVKEEVAE